MEITLCIRCVEGIYFSKTPAVLLYLDNHNMRADLYIQEMQARYFQLQQPLQQMQQIAYYDVTLWANADWYTVPKDFIEVLLERRESS